MLPYVEQLLTIMDELLLSHRRLLDACHRQQRSLILNDPAETERVVAEMDGYVNEIQALEGKRQSVILLLADEMQIPHQNLTVSKLMLHLDPVCRERLNGISTDLRNTLYELRMVNQVNDGLVQNALIYIRKMLHIVATNLDEARYGTALRTNVGGRLFSAEV